MYSGIGGESVGNGGGRVQRVDIGTCVLSVEVSADSEGVVRAAQAEGEASPGFWSLVWPMALPACSYVSRSVLFEPPRRVLEVGAGSGVVGMALAARGCDVVVTDMYAASVELSARNIERNGLGEAARALVWDWSGGAEALRSRGVGEVDVVVGCDVLYDPSGHAGLARSMAELAERYEAVGVFFDPNRESATGAIEVFERVGLGVSVQRLKGEGLERGGRVFVVG